MSVISFSFMFHRHSTLGYNMLLLTCQIELLESTLKFLKLKSVQQHYVWCFKSWIGTSEARVLLRIRKEGWICSKMEWSKRVTFLEGLNVSWCRWVVTITRSRMCKSGIKWAEESWVVGNFWNGTWVRLNYSRACVQLHLTCWSSSMPG